RAYSQRFVDGGRMSGIKVDYATIHTAAEDCNNTGNELEARVEQLKSDLQPLTGDWTGEAQAAWQERQQAWNSALEDLKQVLAQIGTSLPQIASGYQSTAYSVRILF